jgi:pyruvate/2-oxoglutarate dehydrogenase complex dihydrolipoamide dehydrogenase (E3) component
MPGVQRRKKRMVDELVGVHLARYEGRGVDPIMGEARFVAPKTVTVALNEGGTRALSGDRVIVSVGTRAAIPDVPGLADAQPMTHVEAPELDRAPEHLVVVGGGYVGLEPAQAFRRFGSNVTVPSSEGVTSWPGVKMRTWPLQSSTCSGTRGFKCY